MTIERLQAHWGFTRMPFGRDLAPGMLVSTRSHSEAVARIGWLVSEGALGIVTGEVGAGKTVAARAATAALDHRHLVIYLGNPAVGVRGYYRHIVATLGGTPPYQTSSLIAAAVDRLQAERAERGRRVVVVCDEAHLLDPRQLDELRFLTLCRAHRYAESRRRSGRLRVPRGPDHAGGLGIIRPLVDA